MISSKLFCPTQELFSFFFNAFCKSSFGSLFLFLSLSVLFLKSKSIKFFPSLLLANL